MTITDSVSAPPDAPDRGTAGPTALLIAGPPGAGKTTGSRILARHYGWAYLDADTMYQPMLSALLQAAGYHPEDRSPKTLIKAGRNPGNEALEATILDNISAGVNVIATNTFRARLDTPGWLDGFRARAAEWGGRVSVIWVTADEPTIREYVVARNSWRDEWKLANWDRFVQAALRPAPAGVDAIVVNDSDLVTFERQLMAVSDRLLGHGALARRESTGIG